MIARVLKKVFYTSIEGFSDPIKELFVEFLNLIFVQNKEG